MTLQQESLADTRIREETEPLLASLAAGHHGDGSAYCRASRRIHLLVWDGSPSPDFVNSYVIPAFNRMLLAVSAIAETDKGAERYRRNILARVHNLARYVKGLDSAFSIAELDPANAGT